MQLHPLTNYLQDRYDFLKKVEGEPTDPGTGEVFAYVDSKGIPTIGIGLNLQVHWVLVLRTLKFDLDGTVLTGTAREAELDYTDELLAVMSRSYSPNNSSDNAVYAALNQVLQRRKIDPRYAGFDDFRNQMPSDFSFTNTTVSKNVFDTVMSGYAGFTGYETQLDNWLASKGIAPIGSSRERVALVSLTFNNKDALLGRKLAAALKYNDRAEAWYEIRYNSNNGKVQAEKPGIAKRRFMESDTFGLYDAGIEMSGASMNDRNAKGAFRTATRHDIQSLRNYESSMRLANGTLAIDAAINELSMTVYRLDDLLQPARDYLIQAYVTDNPLITVKPVIDGDILVGEDATSAWRKTSGADPTWKEGDYIHADPIAGKNDLIFGESGDDLLLGSGGDDVIYGGAGHDRIYGGLGNDWLLGGAGDDTYVIFPSDGTDHIEDKEGNNTVVFNGVPLKFFWRQGSNQPYLTPDERFRGQLQGGDFIVTEIASGQRVVLNQDFQSGDFGIRLLETNPDPTTTFEWPAVDPDGGLPSEQRTAPNWDGLRNGTALDDNADNWRDIHGSGSPVATDIHGTSGAEVIHGLAGNDYLDGHGGADRLYGDEGNDTLYFYFPDPVGDALADGGSGRDVIFGESAGNNHFIGGTDADLQDEADLIISIHGDDYLEGGRGDDLLFDYHGADLMEGGLGDDYLFSGVSVGHVNFATWSIGPVLDVINGVTRVGNRYLFPAPTMTGLSFLNYAPVSDNKGDVLLGGVGNDYLMGGAGRCALPPGHRNPTVPAGNVSQIRNGSHTIAERPQTMMMNSHHSENTTFADAA